MRTTDRFRRATLLALATLAASLAAGCADMKDQPRFEPLEANAFFPDGRSSRPLVEGTVARGHLRDDDRFYRGLDPDGSFVDRVPIEVDAALLARGRERFDIYCAPCHSQIGDGLGMIVRRGYKQPNTYHSDRLRGIEDGYFYDVITNGFGKMSSYAAQVKPRDRWAIVAYIRALQLSQHTPVAAVAPEVRRALEQGETVDIRTPEHTEEHHGSAH